jgi:hypothetical protein
VLLGCSSVTENSHFQGNYLIESTKLNVRCQDEIINFLSPMDLENDSTKITDVYLLSIIIDTTIYNKDEFEASFFIGLIFDNDTSEYEILACYPETGFIHFCYLINDKTELLIANNNTFFNNFKLIESIKCLEVGNSIKYMEMPKDKIGYWDVVGKSSINGQWLPDTVKQNAFIDSVLNNIWDLQGDLEVKDLQIMDCNNNIIFTEKCDFERDNFILLNKEKEFLILAMTEKTIFLYDMDNEIIHRLNRMNN